MWVSSLKLHWCHMHKSKDVYLYMDIFTYYKSIGLYNFIKQYINHVDVECIDHEWDNEFSYICDMSCQPAHVHLQGTKDQGSQDSIAPASCENSDLALLMQTSWNSWLTSHLNLHCMGVFMGFPIIVARASLWRDQQVALLWGPRFGFNLWIVMHLWLKPPPLPALVSNLVRGHKLKSKKMIQRLLKRLSYVHIYISIYVLWFQAVVKGPGTTGKQHKSIT